MNPSYEYMRRIRLEEQAKLLDMRRERVVKALDGLTLHGDANAMLTQIAYSVHPHVGAWDAESCDHLRNVLKELIGDAREAASGVESHIPCGASGCHSGNESKEVGDGMAGGGRELREDSGDGACGRMDYSDVHQEVVGHPLTQYDVLGNERHKAVCALRAWEPETNYSTDGMGEIHIRILYQLLNLGGAMMMDGADAAKAVRDRLIHLLGGDQSDDSSPMRLENETGITDDLREYVRIHETTTMVYATMPLQMEDKPTPNGDELLAIADEIDEQFARVCEQQEKVLQDTIEQMQGELEKLQSDYDEATTAVSNAVGKLLKLDHDVEMWRNRAEDICMECDELQVKLGESQAERDELQDTITNLLNLLRDARDEYKMLDRMSAETSANFHAMRDRVWGLEAERDELRGTTAELQARLDEFGTQNDMLRDKLDELSTSGATELYNLLKMTVGNAKHIADKLNAHNGTLKESERLCRENAKCAADAINKAYMYLDLLRDAAHDYKALQDKLNHVVEVCQSYAEAKDA